MPRKTKRTPEEDRIGRRDAVRRFRERHPEKVKATVQAWRDAHREHITAYDKARRGTEEFKKKSAELEKERYAKDPESAKARAAAWREKNPEKLKETNKRRWKEHPAESLEYTRKWRAKNRDRVRAADATRRLADPERYRLYGHNRRVIQRGSGGKVTPAEIQELWKKQDGKCAYFATCGNALTDKGPNAAQRDHIEPLKPKDPTKQPGSHEISNLQLVCGLCNRRKKNSDPYEFTQRYAGTLFPDLPKVPKKKGKK